MRQVLLMHGPNLNLLGRREPGIYGALTLAALEAELAREAEAQGLSLCCFQSNHQDRMIAWLDQMRGRAQGVILNAGAYTHTGEALARAVAAFPAPVIEVHISNVFAREPFRHQSRLTPVCDGVICGLGLDGYVCALWALARRMETEESGRGTS